MHDQFVQKIAGELNIAPNRVNATTQLLKEGATVPFIARYRKEVTGELDEVAITDIRDRLAQLEELEKRRDAILKSLIEQGKLTDELKDKVMAAETLTVLEDLYLPYRPKRRTRATIAREKGLEPLAVLIFKQGDDDPAACAEKFVDPEKGVETAADALAGARDIMAEWINEDAEIRKQMRALFAEEGILRAKVIKGKEEEGAKFKDYFEWEEPVARIASHRLLAIRRGANEGFLNFHILPEEDDALALLRRCVITGSGPCSDEVTAAFQDGYKRLLAPSMETEIRLATKQLADAQAIKVFTDNLRELLLASPLGQKNVLALDPGLRTGCKLVCLDRQGKLLVNDTIYPLVPFKKTEEAAKKIKKLCDHFKIEAIAVGNGTGGRELQTFLMGLGLDRAIAVVVVNESGASVYSASPVARDEFPDQDVTVRGAVSIGRRLMDPLAELVKIEPKAIGVGQYQHDVDQKALKQSLDDVVVSCVNSVGAEVNTASKQLLSYVSGLGPKVAKAVVAYRDEKGPFKSRKELLKVPGMGPKTFEQAAGFLRIREGTNPLDGSAVHPESYGIVETMARDLKSDVADLLRRRELRDSIAIDKYVTDKAGLPTLKDIMEELAKPGRDPRRRFEVFTFDERVHEMADLVAGMTLPGVVTNVTDFGAFVDVGVHQDGLVHISELADKFVKNPSDVAKVGQRVTVTVMEVDMARKRIALSMRSNPGQRSQRPSRPAKTAEASRPSQPGRKRAPKKPAARSAPKQQHAERKPRNNPFADFFDKQ